MQHNDESRILDIPVQSDDFVVLNKTSVAVKLKLNFGCTLFFFLINYIVLYQYQIIRHLSGPAGVLTLPPHREKRKVHLLLSQEASESLITRENTDILNI